MVGLSFRIFKKCRKKISSQKIIRKVSLKNTYKVYRGEKTKWLIEAIAEGFDTDGCDYWLSVHCGGKMKRFEKVDLPAAGDRTFTVSIDTRELGIGPMVIVVGVVIPDDDFASGERLAIEKMRLCEVVMPITRRYWDTSKSVVAESIHSGGLSLRATLLEVPAADSDYEYLIDEDGNYLVDEDDERLMCIKD